MCIGDDGVHRLVFRSACSPFPRTTNRLGRAWARDNHHFCNGGTMGGIRSGVPIPHERPKRIFLCLDPAGNFPSLSFVEPSGMARIWNIFRVSCRSLVAVCAASQDARHTPRPSGTHHICPLISHCRSHTDFRSFQISSHRLGGTINCLDGLSL